MDNKYTTFGISRRNPLCWAAAALMVLAAAARIVYYAMGGAEGRSIGWWVFLLVVLPALAALSFAAELLGHGHDRLYKTSFPVLMGAVFFTARIIALYREEGTPVTAVWQVIVCIALYAAAFVIWDLTVNAMRIRTKVPAILVFALPLAYHLAAEDIPLWVRGERSFFESLPEISVLLMMAALLLSACIMVKYMWETYRPRRGDRPDGRLVRSLDPLNGVAIYIMPNRNGAATYFHDTIECSKAEDYIRRKREEGMPGFGMLHIIAAAYVRVIAKHPACNRFISGQKIFTRDTEIELAMAVKKEMTAEAPETIIKVYFEPTDTPADVYRRYTEQIAEAKATPLDSSFDKLAGLINAVPGVIKKFLVWFLKLLDYFGLLPRWIMRLSPFHGSVFVTALGSLGIPPVFHHLYDFGNIPAFIAFGSRRTVTETGDDGQPVRRKYMDFTIVSDERICDGFYYASAFKSFRRYLNNPEKLDTPPEKVEKDVF
ncbi:MAG: hypothetical protein II124_01535 [Clostridia bacterium]|nr:hypothetical protein [Clostridia bacterium]